MKKFAIVQMKKGMKITPTHFLSNQIINHWHFKSECSNIGGGLMPGTAMLEIVEVQDASYPQWVMAKLDGSYDSTLLKITGDELAHMFEEAE